MAAAAAAALVLSPWQPLDSPTSIWTPAAQTASWEQVPSPGSSSCSLTSFLRGAL